MSMFSSAGEQTPVDPAVRELETWASSLRPDDATRQRIRSRARTAFLERYQPAIASSIGRASSTFFGRRASTVLFGLILFAATFGDLKLCSGLSIFGFGTILTRAPAALGTPFVLVGALVAIVGALELVFAFGVWARREWALPLGIGVELASIVLSAAWALMGALLPLQVLTGLVSFAVLSALAQGPVRAALREPRPGFPRRMAG